MNMPKRYHPATVEPTLQHRWAQTGVYQFHHSESPQRPVYAIDTPPPTVSGRLHLGHCYSYSHPDFMARFWRMNGHSVFYPMGYDDNGLPTERLVERRLGITAIELGRESFVSACLEISQEIEFGYQKLWERLGLSVDWRYTYRTIDRLSRRTSQHSFLDLHRKGLAYRQAAPTLWCPECNTAIAQAELNDLDRASEYVTLPFTLHGGDTVPVATTRPELLPACVAVFVHPDDDERRSLAGREAIVPLFGQRVPVLLDAAADPQKGTGAVMCCTFGDVTDISWWYKHHLPLVEAIGTDGRLTRVAGDFAGLTVPAAKEQITQALASAGLVLGRLPTTQSVRVHERCDTPVEYAVTPQWFIKVLDYRDDLLRAGEEIVWHPSHMQARYQDWVENLHWDWCISRQRYFGVPFPLWYCGNCQTVLLADEEQLPLDPADHQPKEACQCGARSWIPEKDVMDTWATSSLTPQIVGKWLTDDNLYRRVFPMNLRPQAHEIIRTWAFYTIVKSLHHFGDLPWREIAISGWGLAPEGTGKISKSRGGGPMPPMEMIDKYSADAVRYWAACTGFGRDSTISEEKIQAGARLVTKLWNVARFAQRFLADYVPPAAPPPLSPADRWILSRMQRLISRVTESFLDYHYETAKSETEGFLWGDLADNYLEMAKQRLYDSSHGIQAGAVYALHQVLLTAIKLLAPLLPHVTEQIYLALYAADDGNDSIHVSDWPQVTESLIDPSAEAAGLVLIEVATAVRRYKSDHSMPLGAELQALFVQSKTPPLAATLNEAIVDLSSITRARRVLVGPFPSSGLEVVLDGDDVLVALAA